MQYETIADVYSANEKIHKRLREIVANVTETEATILPDGEKWTVQQLVEHISIVDRNVARICAKLVEDSKTNGKRSDGTLAIADNFVKQWSEVAGVKLEAPERVQPTGDIPIAGSFEQINANREAFDALRKDFESYDVSGPKFPHPYFGDLTATEWLVLTGGHAARHVSQIENLLEKIRQ